MESLTKLNRLAMDLKASQKENPSALEGRVLKRMNFGIYFHSSSEMIESESGNHDEEQDAVKQSNDDKPA
jgi:hypothetical protein